MIYTNDYGYSDLPTAVEIAQFTPKPVKADPPVVHTSRELLAEYARINDDGTVSVRYSVVQPWQPGWPPERVRDYAAELHISAENQFEWDLADYLAELIEKAEAL